MDIIDFNSIIGFGTGRVLKAIPNTRRWLTGTRPGPGLHWHLDPGPDGRWSYLTSGLTEILRTSWNAQIPIAAPTAEQTEGKPKRQRVNALNQLELEGSIYNKIKKRIEWVSEWVNGSNLRPQPSVGGGGRHGDSRRKRSSCEIWVRIFRNGECKGLLPCYFIFVYLNI